MTTFPSVCGVWTLIIATAKPVMLQVVDEFKEVNRYGGLTEIRHHERPACKRQDADEQCLKSQRTPGVHGSGSVRTLDLTWNGLQHVNVNTAAPWGGGRIDFTGPMAMVGVIVLGCEMEVEHGKQRETCGPPALRAWAAMAEFVGRNDA